MMSGYFSVENSVLTYKRLYETVRIEGWGENGLRVRATENREFTKHNWALTEDVPHGAKVFIENRPTRYGHTETVAVVENGTGKTSRCSALLSVSGFRMSVPTYTSTRKIQVSGAAQRDEQVILSVRYKNANGQDSTKTFSGMVSPLGTYAIDVTLPVNNTTEAQTFTIDAYLGEDLSVGSTTVVYNPSICKIQYLDITNWIHGSNQKDTQAVSNRIDFRNGTGVPKRSFYTYWPELNQFDFTATFDSAGADQIDWVRVDVTYRNGGSSSFDLEKVREDGTVWAVAEAPVINAPVDFSVIYSCKVDGDPIIIHPGLIPITPIMDPSGTVRMNGVPVAGAVVTIYSGDDGAEPNESNLVNGKAFNTTNLQQVNPQVTDESGGFHWDVPEGWWKVVAVKGDQRVESEWLGVLPPHANLTLEFEPGATVRAGTTFEESDAMEIPVMVSFTSQTGLKPVVMAAIYDANGKFIAMDLKTVTGAGEVILTVDNSKGEAAEIRTFLLRDLTGFQPLCPEKSYTK